MIYVFLCFTWDIAQKRITQKVRSARKLLHLQYNEKKNQNIYNIMYCTVLKIPPSSRSSATWCIMVDVSYVVLTYYCP